jgi:hypothetical protein
MERFSSHEQALDYVLNLICQCDAKGLPVGVGHIAKMLDGDRPIKRIKDDRDPRSTVRWLNRLRKNMKLGSWADVIQWARSRQKKSPS